MTVSGSCGSARRAPGDIVIKVHGRILHLSALCLHRDQDISPVTSAASVLPVAWDRRFIWSAALGLHAGKASFQGPWQLASHMTEETRWQSAVTSKLVPHRTGHELAAYRNEVASVDGNHSLQLSSWLLGFRMLASWPVLRRADQHSSQMWLLT